MSFYFNILASLHYTFLILNFPFIIDPTFNYQTLCDQVSSRQDYMLHELYSLPSSDWSVEDKSKDIKIGIKQRIE